MSHAARFDLLEIAQFTRERWGDARCAMYLSQLDARFRALVKDPELGRSCDDIKPGYWRFREGRHVVFYRHDRQTLEVIRVLHERMLPSGHL